MKKDLNALIKNVENNKGNEFTLFTHWNPGGYEDFTQETILYLMDKHFENFDKSDIKIYFDAVRDEGVPFTVEFKDTDISKIIADMLYQEGDLNYFDDYFDGSEYMGKSNFAACDFDEIERKYQ